MATHKQLEYSDEDLCQDIAKADLSISDIAQLHKISTTHVYEIARGDSRPELKEYIDTLIEAEKSAGQRLARSRARWAVARLVQLGNQNEDRRAAMSAIEKLLEMGGMVTSGGTIDKQQIEIVLSAGANGSKDVDPLKRRMTGVVNGNN